MLQKLFLWMFTAFIYNSVILAGDLTFDPNKISSALSDWTHQEKGDNFGEKYWSIYYKIDKKRKIEVFRVLERYMPDFNCILIQASESESLLGKNNDERFFSSARSIAHGFSVRPKKINVLILSFKEFTLIKKPAKKKENSYRFYVRILGGKRMAISAKLYDYLTIVNSQAKDNALGVKFDLDKLCGERKEEYDFKKIASLCEPILSLEHTCVICWEQAKNILLEPCNHMCLCERCAQANATKDCPICKRKYTKEQKVFW